jgi:hypothetical protein
MRQLSVKRPEPILLIANAMQQYSKDKIPASGLARQGIQKNHRACSAAENKKCNKANDAKTGIQSRMQPNPKAEVAQKQEML